jgi:hypothetical protein
MMKPRVIGRLWIVGMWKELCSLSWHMPEGLKKPMKTLSIAHAQVRWPPDIDSKPGIHISCRATNHLTASLHVSNQISSFSETFLPFWCNRVDKPVSSIPAVLRSITQQAKGWLLGNESLLASKLSRLCAKLYVQQFCCGDLKRWLMTRGFKT